MFYASVRNDIFELVPPIDDLGFTHDNVLAVARRRGEYTFGVFVMDRWITSLTDRRRWDQIDAFLTGERPWGEHLVSSLRVGPSFGGNFGGRYLQHAWHSTGTGSTHGGADLYDGERAAGFVSGARLRGVVGERVQGYLVVDGQLALGKSGVSSFETASGVTIAGQLLSAHAEVALTRYHVADPNLALPGAYGVGWQREWRTGLAVHWSTYRFGYQYRHNEGGSHQPIGLFELSILI